MLTGEGLPPVFQISYFFKNFLRVIALNTPPHKFRAGKDPRLTTERYDTMVRYIFSRGKRGAKSDYLPQLCLRQSITLHTEWGDTGKITSRCRDRIFLFLSIVIETVHGVCNRNFLFNVQDFPFVQGFLLNAWNDLHVPPFPPYDQSAFRFACLPYTRTFFRPHGIPPPPGPVRLSSPRVALPPLFL